MGETWLTTTTSASARAPSLRGWRRARRRRDGPGPRRRPVTHRPGVRSRGRPSTGPTDSAGTSRERASLELAVVHLDPPFVDLDGQCQPESLGAVGEPARAGWRRAGPPARATALRARPASERPSGRERSTRPDREAGAPRSLRFRRAERGRAPRRQGTRIRPHCSQVFTASGGALRTRSSSIDDNVRWHPLHEPPTRRAAPVPPSFDRSCS